MHNPYLVLDVALDRQRELIAEADRARLLSAARRSRRAGRRWVRAYAKVNPATRGHPDGSLTPCGPRATA
ncbi:MAG: hypothetical protein GEV03_19660 [Streptosporangiales bacterium]|nr:hypothetical protein [Streptosporangiales bacterium]